METGADIETRADLELDLSGLECPMPLLRAKLALNGMRPGQVLKAVATDPGSERDFRLFADRGGHSIVRFRRDGPAYSYWIRKD